MKRTLFLGALLLGITFLNAQTTQVIDLTTGVSPTPVGSLDPKWTVMVPNSSVYQNAIVSNGNVSNNPPTSVVGTYISNTCGKWISPYTVTSSGSTFGSIPSGSPAGNFYYKMSFINNNGSCPITAVTLNLTKVAADNSMTSISINGNPYNLTSSGISFITFQTVTLSIAPSQILPGTNTIIITVNNTDYFTGMFICGNLSITSANLIPTITGNAILCGGSPLTFTGSASPSSALSHLWEITECNLSGVPTLAGYSWSNWYAGTPGTFTFPTSASVPCGKYYRVRLSLQNGCVDATKIIYVACPPPIQFGAMVSRLCHRGRTSRNINLIASSPIDGYTLKWEKIAPVALLTPIYNGPPVASVSTPTPTVTTTYLCTITDNFTGCSSSASWTVTVEDNNPQFNLTSSVNASSGFYTLSATPVITNTSGIPGFNYTWIVEEIVSTTNTSVIPGSQATYSGTSTPNCWGFNSIFSGYNGPYFTSTGLNPMSGGCNSPATGQFTLGHTYRITRVVSSSSCPSRQYSVIVYFTSASSRSMASVNYIEDADAPDYTEIASSIASQEENSGSLYKEMVSDNAISVYPNPSNGVFTVEMNMDGKVTIEVYDVFGKKIKSVDQTAAKYILDLTDLPKGIYMLNVISNGKRTSKKIILE